MINMRVKIVLFQIKKKKTANIDSLVTCFVNSLAYSLGHRIKYVYVILKIETIKNTQISNHQILLHTSTEMTSTYVHRPKSYIKLIVTNICKVPQL